MNKVAKMLEMPPMQVYEVASFYTMFNRTPIGKFHVQVCTTTPCMLRGAYDILKACEEQLGVKVGHTTSDGMFTLGEVECAGACINAPMLSVGDDYYEDLTVENTKILLERFRKGNPPPPGPQGKLSLDGKNDLPPSRRTCEPVGKKTSLKEPPPGPYCRDLN